MAKTLPIRLSFPTEIPAEGTVVEINGQDVTGSVRALTLRAEVGQLTVLTLELGVLGEVEIDGVVRVEAEPHPDTKES